MKLKFKKNKKNGFSLIETISVLGFMAIAATITYVIYNKSEKYHNILSEVRNLTTIKDGINTFTAGWISYNGINNSILNNSGVIPQSMRDLTNSNNILSTLKTPISISPTSIGTSQNNAFNITYNVLDDDYCLDFVSRAAPNFDQITVNSVVVKSVGQTELNVNNTATACNNSNFGTIVFTYINPSKGNSISNNPVSANQNPRPIYSAPLVDSSLSNFHYVRAQSSRLFGNNSNFDAPNANVTVFIDPRSIGRTDTNLLTLTIQQRQADLVNSAVNAWYNDQVRTNGGSIPSYFYHSYFNNNPHLYMQSVGNTALLILTNNQSQIGNFLPSSVMTQANIVINTYLDGNVY